MNYLTGYARVENEGQVFIFIFTNFAKNKMRDPKKKGTYIHKSTGGDLCNSERQLSLSLKCENYNLLSKNNR